MGTYDLALDAIRSRAAWTVASCCFASAS